MLTFLFLNISIRFRIFLVRFQCLLIDFLFVFFDPFPQIFGLFPVFKKSYKFSIYWAVSFFLIRFRIFFVIFRFSEKFINFQFVWSVSCFFDPFPIQNVMNIHKIFLEHCKYQRNQIFVFQIKFVLKILEKCFFSVLQNLKNIHQKFNEVWHKMRKKMYPISEGIMVIRFY